MSTLVPALIASTLLSIATVPITTLSLQSVRTRVSSQLFHEAETLALSVRKEAAEAEELEIISGTLELTDTSGNTTSYSLPQDCMVAQSNIATVTCIVKRGSLRQSNTQPLYAHRDLIGYIEGRLSFCYSRYGSENASDRDDRLFTALTSVEEFNSLLEQQGNSERFLQIHPLSDAGCQQAINNGSGSTPDSRNDDNDDRDEGGNGGSDNEYENKNDGRDTYDRGDGHDKDDDDINDDDDDRDRDDDRDNNEREKKRD